MDLREFLNSVSSRSMPAGLGSALRAMWLDASGDWSAAHREAQEIRDATGAWIHAYLHRKEGDDANAAYWYARAGRKPSHVPVGREWEEIARALLEGSG